VIGNARAVHGTTGRLPRSATRDSASRGERLPLATAGRSGNSFT
jgi:hypothetical protein